MQIDYSFCGWPSDRPTLDLPHEQFAYAGKFVVERTGKAIARDHADAPPSIVGAVSFNRDRGVSNGARIRYLTVREGYRGNRIGPRLVQYLCTQVATTYDAVRIAVNNPIAYVAMYRAGFGYTGETGGLGETILELPAPDRSSKRYWNGLAQFDVDVLPDRHQTILHRERSRDPPSVISPPGETPISQYF